MTLQSFGNMAWPDLVTRLKDGADGTYNGNIFRIVLKKNLTTYWVTQYGKSSPLTWSADNSMGGMLLDEVDKFER